MPAAKPVGDSRIPEELVSAEVFMFSPRPEDDGFSLEGYFGNVLYIISQKRGVTLEKAVAPIPLEEKLEENSRDVGRPTRTRKRSA